MRKMKDSGVEWIGEIPITWELRRLRFLCDIQTGNMDTQNNNPDGKYPFYVRSPKVEYSDSYTFDNEAVLMAGDGVGAGKVFHYVSGKYGCHQRVYSMSNFTEVNGKYLYYYLSENFYKKIEESNAKSTVDSVRLPMLKDFVVVFPKKNEQEKIVTYLDEKCAKIDAIIEKQQAVIEKLKEYKLSVITEAVTKGLNPDIEMKDSGLKWVDKIPVSWENRKMISILSMRVVDGPHESPELFDDGIPYISATAIENGKINFNLMRGYISKEYCDLCDLRYKPQLHDILVIKLGASTGQVGIVETEERFNIWVPLAAVRCNHLADPYFVYYAFQSDYFWKQMELSWTFGTQQTLGVKTIERLRIMVPPLEEQHQIAVYLKNKCSSIDRIIEKRQNIVDKLIEYKKSLIYEVVTGKKEV